MNETSRNIRQSPNRLLPTQYVIGAGDGSKVKSFWKVTSCGVRC